MSNRTDLNASQLNRLADLLANVSLGELLTLLIANATATQSGLVPSNARIETSTIPTEVFQVSVPTGTVPGIKILQKGVVGSNTLPATGYAVWQVGTTSIKLSAADGVSAVNVLYATATNQASALQRSMDLTFLP
jgi:hypothetical protein